MTHNIIAEFSCSLDSNGNFKQYPVITGSVFNEEYNETLDSATIVLSQVKKEDRLSYIKPYDFVRLFDKTTYNEQTGTYGFDIVLLVDNFNETENNIKEHIFGYTINLMSETKLLEKIQCPNLTVTHKVNEDGIIIKKTIYQKIKEYMELYVPKMKFSSNGTSWSYQPIISIPQNTIISDSDTIETSFDEQDFVFYNEIPGIGIEYEISIVVATLDNNISNVQITNTSISTRAQLAWSTQEVTFNPTTRQILFHGIALGREQGDIFVAYTYDRNDETDFYKRFNVPCADLPFNVPTLRQLLTTLMQQVGCIPTVKNRVLGYLDFQALEQNFGNGDYTVGNTVNKITRSLSSDSFVNSLVNISDQVLDSGNEVICETLGFRDKNNVLLKQKENLYLETSFPIYKINKCILHAPGNYTGYLSSSYGCFHGFDVSGYNWSSSDTYKWPSIFYKDAGVQNNTATVKFRINEHLNNPNISVQIGKIYFWSKDNAGYHLVEVREFGNFVMNNNTLTYNDNYSYYNNYYQSIGWQDLSTKSFTKTFDNLDSSVVAFMFSGNFIDLSTNETKPFTFFRFADGDRNVEKHDMWIQDYRNMAYPNDASYDWRHMWGMGDGSLARYDMSAVNGFQSWDISKLVVEQSVRQLLDNNFSRMNTEMPADDTSKWTIDNLAKYVYGTVGYSIGSNKIEGFSDVFNVGQETATGWMQYEFTYIENIVHFLSKAGETISPLTYVIYNYFEGLSSSDIYKVEGNVEETDDLERPTTEIMNNSASKYNQYNLINSSFKYYDINTDEFGGDDPKFFTGFLVDLYYQPLNSFNLAYVKSQESIDYSLEQYDSGASGVSDFDRLSIHEQEQVDRIGNETLNISQRTVNYGDIQTFENGPLYFMDDTNRSGSIGPEDNGVKYIIFKRSFAINNNCYNVSYTGSKDAVLKDYFTSIRTKYRAYQYIDYSQSTLRKERDTLYIRVASDYFNGDDKVWLGNYSTKNPSNIEKWIYDISLTSTSNDSISYECEYDVGIINTTSNGKSVQTYENQGVKNSVSVVTNSNTVGFIYEYVDNVGAGPYLSMITSNSNLGGVPQSWQIWKDDYNEKHTVSFVSNIDFYGQMGTSSGTSILRNNIKKIEESPIVHSDFIDLNTSPNVIFSIVDDNSLSAGSYTNVQRTFYKDYSERINHTIQFIYYAPDNDVLFGEDFVSGIPLVRRFTNPITSIYSSNEFKININAHNVPNGDSTLNGTIQGYIVLDEECETVELVEISDGQNIYEHTFEFSYASLTGSQFILFSTALANVITQYSYLSVFISQDAKERKIIGKIRNHDSSNGLFKISIPYFYNTRVIKTVDSNNIPVLRVFWGNCNVIKLCNQQSDGKVIDIAVFKRTDKNTKYLSSNTSIGNLPSSIPVPMQRVHIGHHLIHLDDTDEDVPSNVETDLIPYTDFYFTINDTKTDYVLSEKNGILYRRYKVKTDTNNRTVEKIYPNEED